MRKACIGSWISTSKGFCVESWQGGGIDDVAFKQRYDEGFEIGHSCQDEEDKDIFHYIFIREGSKMKVACEMCGTECSLDPEAMRVTLEEKMDIRLAPETRDFLVPAILSPEGIAAGYDLKLIAGSRATVRQNTRDS